MNIWRFSIPGPVLRWEPRAVARPAIGDPPRSRCDIHKFMILMWFLVRGRHDGADQKRDRGGRSCCPCMEIEGPYRATTAAPGGSVAARLQPSGWFATNEPRRICQIPRTMKIVYTQGCAVGPERDNQLSYTRTIQRCRRGLKRVLRISRVAWPPSELASIGTLARLSRCSTSTTRLDASLGEPRCETRQPADAQPLKVASHDS
jgi:hypothetical protein